MKFDKEYYDFLVSKFKLSDPTFDKDYFDTLISTNNYKDMVHDVLKNVIKPEFSKRGFKKKGNTFYREREGLIEICNVQFSRNNTRYSGSFTYNIQLASPSLYDLFEIDYTDRLQTIIFFARLGNLILWSKGSSYAFNTDFWYRLEVGEMIMKTDELTKQLEERYNKKTGEGFAEVIADDIENIIIKFFKSVPNVEELLNQISDGNPNKFTYETMCSRVEELLGQ